MTKQEEEISIMTTATFGSDNHPSSKIAGAAINCTIAAILLGPIFAIITNINALIPDALWRASASASPMPIVYAFFIAVALMASAAMLLKKHMFGATYVVLFCLVYLGFWFMAAQAHATDFEGERNPYIRAQDADASTYADLAKIHNDPRIAPLIRRARTDGRITQGEAYDILHSKTYEKMLSDDWRKENAKNRSVVLGETQ